MRTPRLPVVDWSDATADLNGLVRFAQRRYLISARVPCHFNWPLHDQRNTIGVFLESYFPTKTSRPHMERTNMGAGEVRTAASYDVHFCM